MSKEIVKNDEPDIEVLEADIEKIKKIDIDKFLPGRGIKKVKALGVAALTGTASLIAKVTSIPYIGDAIATLGISTENLFVNRLINLILKHYYPYMDPSEIINVTDLEAIKTSYANLEIINQAMQGKGEAGWFGKIMTLIGGFFAEEPEFLVAGGTVLIVGLIKAISKITQTISKDVKKGKINEKGSLLQKECLTKFFQLIDSKKFSKLKYHRKFKRYSIALVYVIDVIGGLSDEFLIDINKYLDELTNKVENDAVYDLKLECQRFELVLKGAEVSANEYITCKSKENTQLKLNK